MRKNVIVVGLEGKKEMKIKLALLWWLLYIYSTAYPNWKPIVGPEKYQSRAHCIEVGKFIEKNMQDVKFKCIL